MKLSMKFVARARASRVLMKYSGSTDQMFTSEYLPARSRYALLHFLRMYGSSLSSFSPSFISPFRTGFLNSKTTIRR
ncbi:hypothetical protein PBCV1_a457R [Paramecium bursaria Chlorella virus 1]|uniref:Uncharacterized protein n=1 Tax=Paramecium bursaria Chlorella virus 1 TaxID=10506 RepID=Q98508_PBCV1|nr:hypothetical protein PBCV1_a457R [Paramecium bursaria Chlorella virus 1]AAC96825.1 hypothetical protein [Paramecium bursaria Chlorella virus 1]